jgi:hypothetical protein
MRGALNTSVVKSSEPRNHQGVISIHQGLYCVAEALPTGMGKRILFVILSSCAKSLHYMLCIQAAVYRNQVFKGNTQAHPSSLQTFASFRAVKRCSY